jgi:hypothetical protein
MQAESSPECELTGAAVTRSLLWQSEQGEWVTVILTMGNKKWRGDRDEPAVVGSSW